MDDSEAKILRAESSGDKRRTDRISELPDSVLCQILLNLPTEESVRTSVLSTRWQNLWESVPVLDLGSKSFSEFSDFVDFVYMFLDLPFQLQKCSLRYDDCRFEHFDVEHDYSLLQLWIDDVVRRRIRHLTVENCSVNAAACFYVDMPLTFYICYDLVSVELSNVTLYTAPIVYLPRLKKLALFWIDYDEDLTVEKLISGCSALEDVAIKRMTNDYLTTLHVRSETLKVFSLHVKDVFEDRRLEIVIDAPKLSDLSVDDYGFKSIVVKNSSSLVKVDLDANFAVPNGRGLDSDDLQPVVKMIRSFLVGISSVRHLTLHQHALEALYEYSKMEPLPQLCYLSHFEAILNAPLLDKLATVLERCPNLKSIVLQYHPNMYQKIRLSSVPPPCLLSSVEVIRIRGSIKRNPNLLKNIVRYFLKNSVVLKKLSLTLVTRIHTTEEASDFLKVLEALPRRSAACELAVERGFFSHESYLA